MRTFLLFTFLCFFSGVIKAETPMKISDHFDGTHFYNLDGKSEKGFLDVLKWKLTSTVESWSNYPTTPVKYVTPENKVEGLKITFIGHATFLIQLNGFNILTDPVWSQRASPFSFLGPKRYTEVPVELEKLPKIDIVLVSHNHYDHMDNETLSFLGKRDNPLFIVPLENKKTMQDFGLQNIVELDWWDAHNINDKMTITLLPARHWSRRSLRDTNQSLWGSFLLSSGSKNVYFAGDTGFGKHFELIAKKYPEIDVAMIPIGAYEPRWFMKEAHMNPEDAVDAHLILKPKQSIGMHFGTFQLTDEGPLKPIEELEKICAQKLIGNFIAPMIGQEFKIEK